MSIAIVGELFHRWKIDVCVCVGGGGGQLKRVDPQTIRPLVWLYLAQHQVTGDIKIRVVGGEGCCFRKEARFADLLTEWSSFLELCKNRSLSWFLE